MKKNQIIIFDAIESIEIETDEENPTTIARISNDEIQALSGYRVRLKPKDN